MGTCAVLLLLATSLLACGSDEQIVTAKAPLSHSPSPTPSVTANTSDLRYVSPAGNDDNPGTLDQPWRTLSYALGRVISPQVLFVRGGTYRENVDHIRLHHGTADRPITVLAYPGENPVLVGSISLPRPVYWMIDNLDVTGDPADQDPPSFMVKIVGGHAWTWENSEFTNTVDRANVFITGWGVAEPSDFIFRGNCLHGLPQPPQGSSNLFLGSMQSGAHGLVARNVIFNTDDQPNVRIGSAAGAPQRVKLVSNTIYGGSLGIDVRGRPHRISISRNVLGGTSAPAEIRFPRQKSEGTSVTNNVAVNTQQMLRPEVRKTVHGYGNLELPGHTGFVDTTRCDGFRSGQDAMVPYGAFAP
jgi:hypothetical protein